MHHEPCNRRQGQPAISIYLRHDPAKKG
ncbi:hypothetical protein L195_g064077, partial [Trifolium pratense]